MDGVGSNNNKQLLLLLHVADSVCCRHHRVKASDKVVFVLFVHKSDRANPASWCRTCLQQTISTICSVLMRRRLTTSHLHRSASYSERVFLAQHRAMRVLDRLRCLQSNLYIVWNDVANDFG